MTTAPGATKRIARDVPEDAPRRRDLHPSRVDVAEHRTLDQQIAIRVVDVRLERAARRDDHVAATRERAREVALHP